MHIELLLQLCGIGWPYGIGMLYSGLGLGLESLYGIELSHGIEPLGLGLGLELGLGDTEPLRDSGSLYGIGWSYDIEPL